MQRTVHGTKVTFATISVDDNGEIKTEVRSAIIAQADEKKALRIARKEYGANITVVKCEPIERKYFLDDETFFKYAKEVTNVEENK